MSQNELVDIVDENGNFLEVVSKREAHEKGLLHKVVITEVIDSKGQWIMVKQSKSRQDAGQYVSPVGGHVTSGEKDIEALKREANEELGLTGDFKIELIGRKIFNRDVIGRHENHLFIVYKIYSDQEPVINEESESYKYFTEEEIKKELKENPETFGGAFHFVVKTFFPNLFV
jgi:isopentenyl-diphosphate delta-isomerase